MTESINADRDKLIFELKWALSHIADALKKTSDPDAVQSLCYASKHLNGLILTGLYERE